MKPSAIILAFVEGFYNNLSRHSAIGVIAVAAARASLDTESNQ